jgi:hypothetical protein
MNTWGNDLRHSNNEKDWTICSQASKCDNASIRRRFRDYNGMGLRKLATFNEDLRNSPSSNRNIWVRLGKLGVGSLIQIKHTIYGVYYVIQCIFVTS